MKLSGRRILITGAASGIGREIAFRFAAEGAAVALVDRAAEPLAAACAELDGGHAPAVSSVADVAKERDVQAAVAHAVERLGGLDGIVNAAGIDMLRPLHETSLADWQQVLGVNVTGPYLVCRAALPQLKAAGGGTIVNIASGAALRPLEHRTAYCASKAALVMFGKALSIEAAAFNIRVNAICPGIIDTPQFRSSWENADDPDRELARILDRYALKRVGKPADIANAALFLTSDDSSFVTGAAFAVDGGRTFH